MNSETISKDLWARDPDALTELLTALHARGAFALRMVMEPPFSLRIQAEAPITLLAPVSGKLCIIPDSETGVNGERNEPHWIGPGDVAITRGPDHYLVADSPETKTSVIIQPGQQCFSPDGRSMHEEMMHGTRTWGNDPQGSVLCLVGAYHSEQEVSRRLVRCLPPVLSLKESEWDSALITVLSEEMKREGDGQGALLDRLIDVLLVTTIKAWMAKPQSSEDALASQNDPVVGEALRIMRQDPARNWSVESLSLEIGVSRSALSRRFSQVVGEPPMAFLTRWRMALAADWICEPDATVSTVAEQLGYSTPFAFSTAFKRIRGMSPKAYREQVLSSLA